MDSLFTNDHIHCHTPTSFPTAVYFQIFNNVAITALLCLCVCVSLNIIRGFEKYAATYVLCRVGWETFQQMVGGAEERRRGEILFSNVSVLM